MLLQLNEWQTPRLKRVGVSGFNSNCKAGTPSHATKSHVAKSQKAKGLWSNGKVIPVWATKGVFMGLCKKSYKRKRESP